MGNSNSDQSNDDEEQNNDENGDNGDNSYFQNLGNKIVVIESVIYILGHLWRIYERVNDPNKNLNNDLLRYREPIFENVLQENYNNNDIYNVPNVPNILDQIKNEPIVPEGGIDELIPEDDDSVQSCVICTTNKIKTVFLPCGHSALCISCSREYAQRELSKVNPKLICVICKQDCTSSYE